MIEAVFVDHIVASNVAPFTSKKLQMVAAWRASTETILPEAALRLSRVCDVRSTPSRLVRSGYFSAESCMSGSLKSFGCR